MGLDYLWMETDDVIRVRGLKDVVADTYINNATITAALYDADGNVVTGASAINISYVAGTDGDYAGEIPYSVSLTEGASYTAKVTIVGSGYQTVYEIVRRAGYKGP